MTCRDSDPDLEQAGLTLQHILHHETVPEPGTFEIPVQGVQACGICKLGKFGKWGFDFDAPITSRGGLSPHLLPLHGPEELQEDPEVDLAVHHGLAKSLA